MKMLFAIAAYTVGSIPTGFILVRAADRKDIREFGSRSTGATNVLRTKGWKYAIPVAGIDILKGALPTFLAWRIYNYDLTFASLCAFLAVVGHCFPFTIGFRGGKGVATFIGACAILVPGPLVISLGVFLLVVSITRYVSLGSLTASLSLPVMILLFHKEAGAFYGLLAASLLIAFQHKGNISRLLAGTERKFGRKLS